MPWAKAGRLHIILICDLLWSAGAGGAATAQLAKPQPYGPAAIWRVLYGPRVFPGRSLQHHLCLLGDPKTLASDLLLTLHVLVLLVLTTRQNDSLL